MRRTSSVGTTTDPSGPVAFGTGSPELAEHGVIAPTGIANLDRLAATIKSDSSALPAAVVALARILLAQVAGLTEQIDALEKEVRQRAARDETPRRLMTIPGVGAIVATALTTFSPPPETFSKGRDFAAWAGLTPRQHSSGGKERLGRTSKMGQRDIRRLLIIGAAGPVRWAVR